MAINKKSLLINISLFYASLIWGATFIVVKNVLAFVDPVALTAYRFIFAAISLLIILLFMKKNPFTDFKPGLFLGILMFLLYIFQTIGLKYTTASNSGFITGLFVVFVPITSYIFYRKVPSVNKIIAVIISLVGLWILTGGIKNINIGDSLTLIAAITYAWHIFLTDIYAKNDIDPWVLSFQQFFTVGVLSFISCFITGTSLSVANINSWWVIIFLALFPSVSAFVIHVYAQKTENPLKVSLIFMLESPFAAIFAWTFGKEKFILQNAMGGVIIFIAMIISELNFLEIKKK